VSHDSEQTKRIRELNDSFRSTFTGGRVLTTIGIAALPSDVQAIIIRKVVTFSEFSEDNDPHHEHDFGNFHVAGHYVFWKIDYYDKTMDGGSEDPSDPAKTERVLIIMLASEY
jgi:hypothetical protein